MQPARPDAGPASVAPWRPFLAPSLVAAAAVGAFAVALRGGFIWDDVAFLPPGAKLLGVSDLSEIFSTGIWAFANVEVPPDVPVYRPLAALVLRLLAPAFAANPAAWHALPLALHALNALLVFALVRRLEPRAPLAALAAGLMFAVLPCHLEAVAWIMAFAHPLATGLALLAAHAQLSHIRGGAHVALAVSAVAATAAALAFEGAIMVAPLLVALEWVERRERPRARVFLACALSVAIPLVLRGRALSTALPIALDAEAFSRAASFGAAYVRDLLAPWPPPPHGSFPRGGVAGWGTWAIASAIVAGAGVLVARIPPGERRRPLFALAWIALGLAPPIVAAMSASPFYAPRTLYFPSVGAALFVAALLSLRGEQVLMRWRWAAGALALSAVAVGNVAALGWLDDATVYRRMVEVDPKATALRLKLADILDRAGRGEEALEQLQTAARRAESTPARLDALEALGVHFGTAGRLDEAERHLAMVLREDDTRTTAWTSAGNVALLRGDATRARQCYLRALQLAPRNAQAAYNLALALDALGDSAGASAARRQAAALGADGRGN